ncbi:hypothetical protein [Streptomyces bacillaris]
MTRADGATVITLTCHGPRLAPPSSAVKKIRLLPKPASASACRA